MVSVIQIPQRDDETRALARAVAAPSDCTEAKELRRLIADTTWYVAQALYEASDCRTEKQLCEVVPDKCRRWVRTALRSLAASRCVASHPDTGGTHYYLTDDGEQLAQAN